MDFGNILSGAGGGALAGFGVGGPWGAAVGGGLGLLNSFLNPPDRPYRRAMKPINAGYDEAKKYQLPFYQHGVDEFGRLNEAENQLLNPENLEARFASNYETSPYAKNLLKMNEEEGLDAASKMGLMGSSAALSNIQRGAGNIVAREREKFLNDLMQKYMAGIGLGKDIYGVGASTGNQLGLEDIQRAQDLAGLEYGKSAAPGSMFEKLAGAGISAGLMRNAGLFNAGNEYNQGVPPYMEKAIYGGA